MKQRTVGWPEDARKTPHNSNTVFLGKREKSFQFAFENFFTR